MAKAKSDISTNTEEKSKDGYVELISGRMPDGRYLVAVRYGKKVVGGYVTSPPLIGATVPIVRGVPVL